MPFSIVGEHDGCTVLYSQQQHEYKRHIEVLGKGAIKFQDDIQPYLQDKDTQEVLLILGHLCMPLLWPREYRDLPAELGCYVGSDDKRRKTFQLVRHVGSLDESACIQCLESTQGSTSNIIHVFLPSR